jgi:hypothetical protein
MGTKSREVLYGGQVRAARMNADRARKLAVEAAREADRAEAHAWSLQMEGFGGPAQRSPTIARCLNGGYGWLEVKYRRCETRLGGNVTGLSIVQPEISAKDLSLFKEAVPAFK